MDHTERYTTTRLYRALFCPLHTDDEEKDLTIQTHIRSLHWITAEQLDTIITDHDPEVRRLMDQAITGLYYMPQDWKLLSLAFCPNVKWINFILKKLFNTDRPLRWLSVLKCRLCLTGVRLSLGGHSLCHNQSRLFITGWKGWVFPSDHVI